MIEPRNFDIWKADVLISTESNTNQFALVRNGLLLRGQRALYVLHCDYSVNWGEPIVSCHCNYYKLLKERIDYANEQAKKENLNAKFICQDIRTITFDKEFDVVLNMADGAIGYLEDDGENHKIFSVIAKALKNGGKHFMDIMNGSYAQTHFPCKLWDAGEKGLTLSAFEWEKDRKTLIYGQVDYMYGEALYKPEMKEGNPIRLYSLDEITEIFCKLGLRICNSFADFSGKPSSDNDIQLMVYSIRE